jgi:MFS superfamily sulfate permease-like transporter
VRGRRRSARTVGRRWDTIVVVVVVVVVVILFVVLAETVAVAVAVAVAVFLIQPLLCGRITGSASAGSERCLRGGWRKTGG